MQLDPDHLAALTAILRRGSFEAAAHELSLTPSAVSQRIKALEERIGASLINRGNPCTATPTGERLAKHAENIGLLESQLARELHLEQPGETRLRIAVNADSLATWFIPALAAVPGIFYELVIDDQDHSADWLRRGEVSAAITASAPPVAGCDATPLGNLRYFATASPGFAAQWFPHGPSLTALKQAPCLVFNAKDALQRRWIEAQTGQRLSPPAHTIPSTHAFIDAAQAGLGWGMNPELLLKGPLEGGKLVNLDPARPLDVALSWQVSRIMAPALTRLSEAVKQAARATLRPL